MLQNSELCDLCGESFLFSFGRFVAALGPYVVNSISPLEIYFALIG